MKLDAGQRLGPYEIVFEREAKAVAAEGVPRLTRAHAD